MRITLLALLAALTLGGCYWELDSGGGYYEDEYVYDYGYDYVYDQELVVSQADIYGDMSYVQGFSGGIYVQEPYAYEGYSQLTIYSESSYGTPWAAMTQIEVDGGLNGQTVTACARAGANAIVAGSYIFKGEDIRKRVSALRAGWNRGAKRFQEV